VLQDGRVLSTSFPNTTGRLDGEVGLKGCLPSGSNSPTLSLVPTVPMAQGPHISLPFGLSVAPCVFTKLLKPVVGLLRHTGTRFIIYLDDLLILHQSKEMLEALVTQTCQLFEGLGLMINRKKSQFKTWEFLGFQVCSNTLRL